MTKTPKYRENMVVRRYEAGRTRRDIGQELGMKPETVKKILEGRGFAFVPQRRNKLTVEQEQQVIARYPEVKSSKALGEEFGCNSVTILNILRRAGITTQRRGNVYREFTPDQVQEMIAFYHAGQSQAEIAVAFGSSQPTISRILIEQGVRSPEHQHLTGERHRSWRGGRVNIQGYEGVKLPPDSPYASMRHSNGYVLEHRLVMAEALGRPLMDYETVHHIDGKRANNDLSNLQLRLGKHGSGVVYRCADCGSRHIVADELASPP